MENLQEQLQTKFDQIEAAIKEIESIKDESYRTSGAFRYNPTNSYSSLDIHTTLNESELIHANAFIQNKSSQYNASAEQLGLKEYPLFKWCGYTPDDWFHDIKLRFKFIKYHTRLQELKSARERMIPYLPQENKIKQLLLELPAIA